MESVAPSVFRPIDILLKVLFSKPQKLVCMQFKINSVIFVPHIWLLIIHCKFTGLYSKDNHGLIRFSQEIINVGNSLLNLTLENYYISSYFSLELLDNCLIKQIFVYVILCMP
jgi:hypothetical protein